MERERRIRKRIKFVEGEKIEGIGNGTHSKTKTGNGVLVRRQYM